MVNLQDSREIKWCTVNLSDVFRRGGRLEASVFDVEAKKAHDAIVKGKYEAVNLYSDNGFVANAHYGSRLRRNYVSKLNDKAVGFLGSSEMLDVRPSPVKFMVNDNKVDDLHVKLGTVLLSRSGTIGNVAFVGETLSKYLISEHAIRLECREFPGYVYACLKTKTGKTIVCSNIYGAVIEQIEPEHLSTVPIPNPPEEIKLKINDLIVKSFTLRDESNKLIDDATKLLTDELKLPPIEKLELDLYDQKASVETYSVKLSNLKGRMDGSYHVPVVQAIIDRLKANAAEITHIGDKTISKDIILPGRFKRVYVDEGFGRVFIGGKQIGELDPTNKKYLSIKKHGDRISKQLELHENMTLITCSGTIGKVALVGKHWEKWTANQHIIRVVPAAIDVAGYLNIFLASDYGHALITRYTYGSVVDEIDDRHVRDIPFPLLKDKAVQNKINEMALEANQKRYEAYLAEQEALRIMNDEVIFAGED